MKGTFPYFEGLPDEETLLEWRVLAGLENGEVEIGDYIDEKDVEIKVKKKKYKHHDPGLKDVLRGRASSKSTAGACTSATCTFLFPPLSPRLLHSALLNLLNTIVDVD